MLRVLVSTAACLVIVACHDPSSPPIGSRETAAVFHTGPSPGYPPRIAKGTKLPAAAEVSAIIGDPVRFQDERVTIQGCYTIDPYHGSALFGSNRAKGGIRMLGGSDDTSGHPFDWTKHEVCGTFVGVIRWKPTEDPLKYLCPDLCFIGEGTVESRIVARDDAGEN